VCSDIHHTVALIHSKTAVIEVMVWAEAQIQHDLFKGFYWISGKNYNFLKAQQNYALRMWGTGEVHRSTVFWWGDLRERTNWKT
jgi:hypothetical protein